MSLEILHPGLFTSVQDLGRWGYQDQGVSVGGAMDRPAAALANVLVGNSEEMAVLEFTVRGPKVRFRSAHLIALTGADLGATLEGVPLMPGRPALARAKAVLDFAGPARGRHGYLAVAGGFVVSPLLGSCSTHLRAGFGGFQGRALQEGDVLKVPKLSVREPGRWWVEPAAPSATLRVVRGPEAAWFSEVSAFLKTAFTLTPQSDRMGFRLQSRAPMYHSRQMVSSAVCYGTVQLPPDGHPIVLMADGQTTGGYPRIAQVITADLPALAQALPGAQLSFREVSANEARDILFAERARLETLKEAIRMKWAQG